MNLEKILNDAVAKKASDIFIVAGHPLSFKLAGQITPVQEEKLTPNDTKELLAQIYQLAEERSESAFDASGDDDFSFSLQGVGRFRVNAYKQRGSKAAVLRIVTFQLPDPKELGIPRSVIDLYQCAKGLVLITGPAGSGKSTTLSCMIDELNRTRNAHIITIEDPIEYLHRHQNSIVSQREVAGDTVSYVRALRAALRQSPDVILLGEMRDYETIDIAMTAAETGQLVLSTLHTLGAANTIDRIIDVFPSDMQQQIRVQLSMVLRAVVSQQLVPSVEGKLIPVFEVMKVNSAIRTLIREKKTHQIDNAIYSGKEQGMASMDEALLDLYAAGRITAETARTYAFHPESIEKKL